LELVLEADFTSDVVPSDCIHREFALMSAALESVYTVLGVPAWPYDDKALASSLPVKVGALALRAQRAAAADIAGLEHRLMSTSPEAIQAGVARRRFAN